MASASPVTLHASTTSGCRRSVSVTRSSSVPGAKNSSMMASVVAPSAAWST
jgi:hypothetical protein